LHFEYLQTYFLIHQGKQASFISIIFHKSYLFVLNTGQTHQENPFASLRGDVKQVKIEDLPLFEFKNISTATNNFSLANKIGHGGFGSVYKVN
jgi:hypothetical protein